MKTNPSLAEVAPFKYCAFISYSQFADGRLAKAVQAALQGFNKPWYRLRSRRVFRDQTGLAITPALWEAIEKSLRSSGHFILFASRSAAESDWVRKEVAWWRQHRSTSKLLIVWTDGELAWDAAGADFDWSKTNALPRTLEGAFHSVPLYLDLRWARPVDGLSLRQPRFAAAVAQLAASLEGVSPDELISEDIRQHQKAMRMLRYGVALLLLVTIASVAAAFIALEVRSKVTPLADAKKIESELRERESESRRLAALSLRSSERDLAILLAAEAVGTHRTPEAESALRRSFSGESKPKLTLPGDSESIAYCAFSPDGKRVLTWPNGGVKLYDAATAQLLVELGGQTDRVRHAGFSKDGTRIHTTGEDGSVLLWQTATGRRSLVLKEAGASAALMSPDATRILTVAEGGDAVLWDAVTGSKIKEIRYSNHLLFSDEIRDASFHPDSSRLAICGTLDAVLMDAKTGEELKKLEDHAKPISSIVFSPNGEWLVTASEDSTVRRWRTASGQCEKVIEHNQQLFDAKISPDEAWIAARDQSQNILIWNAETGVKGSQIETGASQDGPVLYAFSPNGRCVITANYNSSSAQVWETSSGVKLVQLVGAEGEVRTIHFSPDGSRVAIGSVNAPARIHDCEACSSLPHLQTWASTRVTRKLTKEERQKYGLREFPP